MWLPGAAAEEKEKEEEEGDAAWKALLQGESEGTEPEDVGVDEDSGEDSDAEAASTAEAARQKNDLDLLLKQAKVKQQPSPVAQSSPSDSASKALHGSGEDHEEEKQSSAPETKPAKRGLLNRLFGRGEAHTSTAEDWAKNSLLSQDVNQYQSDWYAERLSSLNRGMKCTKVGTNGKPYDRYFYIDSRNLMVEIRGGRTGSTGVLLDDLVDVRKGLSSPELELFASTLAQSSNKIDVVEHCLVLQTPHRTFSFVLPSVTFHHNVVMCILFLLKSKNRGMMATQPANAKSRGPVKGPKQGQGKAIYNNGSSYEGQFQNYLRHGAGTLTLSDGTKYEAQWKNDERHGKGSELCPDGTTFEGSYLYGMRHGHGKMTWPEGSQYMGNFERGRANGEGELLRTDGSVYKGQFAEDCMSGEGKMRWRDGVEYVGQFVANRREGFGKMVWCSGRWKSYEGYWKDGMQHEAGTLTDHDGREFKGIFKLGKLDRWLED